MNGAYLLGIGAVLFILAYRIYGRYLERLFGVEPERRTPACVRPDNVDYVPTRPAVLFGHHFASIAGAGPIVGPVAALYFGWVPVVLWIIVGCILVGAFHDFAALFLSTRHGGQSVGQVIDEQIGFFGRQIFLVFCWAALVLVVAVFAAIVSGTFTNNPSAATSSLLFIVLAPIFGWLVYQRGISVLKGSLIFVPLLFLFVWVGIKLPLDLAAWGVPPDMVSRVWLWGLLAYAVVASVVPVWLLLQPRDYLNSFLLYGMMLVGLLGVLVARPTLQMDAFSGWSVMKGGAASSLFPILFITVACGACSGFHALVASGTTAKQLESERHILPIGYGSMLVEGLLALMAVVSVAYLTDAGAAEAIRARTPVGAFAAGLASFSESIGLDPKVGVTFFSLAISAFLLTTLDTATRLARFTWQEMFIPRGAAGPGATPWRRVLANRFLATAIVAAIAAYLTMARYTAPDGTAIPAWRVIWPVFGASNQLLAALTLLVVTLVLVRRRANFWVAFVPMCFMMVVCIWALVLLLRHNIGVNAVLVSATGFLLLMALALVILAVWSLRRPARP